MCCCSKEGPQHPGVHLEEDHQQVKGGDPLPLISTGETSGYHVQFWASPGEGGHGHNGVSPVNSHKDCLGTGAPDTQETRKAETLQHGEEKAHGILAMCVNT